MRIKRIDRDDYVIEVNKSELTILGIGCVCASFVLRGETFETTEEQRAELPIFKALEKQISGELAGREKENESDRQAEIGKTRR